MDQEEQTSSSEPITPNPNIPDSTFDADSITQKDRGINTLCNQYSEKMRIDSNSTSDCVSTPPPSLNLDSKMVTDTCPGAPMKLSEISSYNNPGLRRKLF